LANATATLLVVAATTAFAVTLGSLAVTLLAGVLITTT